MELKKHNYKIKIKQILHKFTKSKMQFCLRLLRQPVHIRHIYLGDYSQFYLQLHEGSRLIHHRRKWHQLSHLSKNTSAQILTAVSQWTSWRLQLSAITLYVQSYVQRTSNGALTRCVKLRECLERFLRHRGLAIPTCIPARAWRTCRDACWDR